MTAARHTGPRELVDHLLQDRSSVTYIQVARGLRFARSSLRLEDLSPSTIWVLRGITTRTGQVSTGAFLDLWWDAENGMASPAPRACLSLLDADAQLLGEPVLQLSAPRISGSGLTYHVDVLAGVLPKSSGACVLFINPPEDTGEAHYLPDPRRG